MKRRPKILVVGSFVMDLIVTTEKFPNAGETVLGTGFVSASGGKGANQAVQAARLGADVTMVGRVGRDDFGARMIESVKKSGVRTEKILLTDGVPSAIGNVQIQQNGSGSENRIVVVSGANRMIQAEDVAFLQKTISEYDMVILQLEIPMEINILVAGYAAAAGVPVMLNPAPSAEIPQSLMECLTYISPNEHEVQDITSIEPEGERGIAAAASALHQRGVRNVLITLGKRGCAFSDGIKLFCTGSVDCGRVVDPTAAGDSFIGAFCTGMAAGIEVERVLRFANCAGGITVSKMGAQTSLPTLDEVLERMEEKGFDGSPFELLRQ